MVLKGLSGTKDKPLAIINNYTFAEGEEAEVRVINQLYRVKVVEIKERAVMIQVNGTEPRELTLRQGVY
jgi:acetolactate synthase small subunit